MFKIRIQLKQKKDIWHMMQNLFKFSTAQVLVLGFLAVIIIGANLLNLPIASKNGESVGLINAIFTATSAVCVTGLVVVNTGEHWTLFGQWVILFLIQIGGLGFMTMVTMLFMFIGKKITLRERLIIQESFNQNNLQGVVKLTKHVLLGTLLIEGAGAVILAIRFAFDVPLGQAIYWGIFHSISAFCNAGFDITGDSMVPYVDDFIVNIIICLLIILGGLGFAVWVDLKRNYEAWRNKEIKGKNIIEKANKLFANLTLHSKLVLSITAILIIVGFLFIFIIEYNNSNTLGNLSLSGKTLAALFQAVVPRTAGFYSIDIASMNNASIFMTMILMFIGGSPGATAGGIKTVTFGVIILSVFSVLRGKEDVEVFDRKITFDLVLRALVVTVLGMTVVIVSTMILYITEQSSFEMILFETISAFATVGSSLGITPQLSSVGKIIICIVMFLGRLGPITIALALMQITHNKKKAKIAYPEEKVLIG